ncbi:MAG: restriction endonuclease subunit S [Hydrococcus sp. Prado102]|nr:restriction endonuclease subunit S [Hydrococcus sp. Prado102]
MSIPSEIALLVEQLERELNEIEKVATEGLRLSNIILKRFPNNFAIIQLFAFLNSSLFFVNTSRQKIQNNLEYLSTPKLLNENKIQEVGQDLAIELGRILETKIAVTQIKNRLESLQ